jgi:diguanylate cyclase (GGDEF)-like protein
LDNELLITADGAGGRFLYLADTLGSLHAASDMPSLAGRFEFLGEKAVGAVLTALALADEGGAYRAVASSAPRPATARALWEELGFDALPANEAVTAAFAEVAASGRADVRHVAGVFPGRVPTVRVDDVLITPVTYNREMLGMGIFITTPDALALEVVRVLSGHTAVAIHQLRLGEDARRLHSIDPRLWIPDENFLLQQLRREVTRARRYGREVGLALLRLENEDDVRYRFGDFFTDHLLRRIGSLLASTVRDSDILGALDGGFAVIHTETALQGTLISAGRLRDAAIGSVRQRFPEVPDVRISIAVTAFPDTAATVDEMLAQLRSPGEGSRAA